MSFTDVLFKPNGRIGQGQFWAGCGVVLGGNIILNFLAILGILVWLGLVYVGWCVYGKRLHDMGKSAALHAIPWAIVSVLAIAGFIMSLPQMMTAMSDIETMSDEEIGLAMLTSMGPLAGVTALNLLIWLGYTIWLGVSPSDPQDNQYGPAPGSPGMTDTFV